MLKAGFPLIAALFFFSVSRIQAFPVRIGYIAYPPIVVNSASTPNGYLIDYVDKIFKASELTTQWHELAVDRGLFQLQQGQLEIFLGLLKSVEREKLVRFSKVPLYEGRSAVCAKAGRIRFPLKSSLRIAHFLSTLIPPSIQQHQLMSVTPDDTTNRLLGILHKDRADAFYYVNPELLALYLAEMKVPFNIECYIFTDIHMQVFMAFGKSFPLEQENKLNTLLLNESLRNSFSDFLQKMLAKYDRRHLKIIYVDSKLFQLPGKSKD